MWNCYTNATIWKYKAKIFRLKKDNAIINRLGFNNKEKRFVKNLMSAKRQVLWDQILDQIKTLKISLMIT